MELDRSKILRIPVDLSLSTKTWKLIIKTDFNGKKLKDCIKINRQEKILSSELDNIFSVSEFLGLQKLEDDQITDEEIENGIQKGLSQILRHIIRTLDKIEEAYGSCPSRWCTPAYVVLYEHFATVAVELELKEFLENNPQSNAFISDAVLQDIKSIVVSDSHYLIMLIGQDDEILTASIDKEFL